MRINFKNFGLLEALVFLSLVYVVGMLIWTASTRPAVEAKANLVKENHKKVVDFINGEINNCGNNDEGKLTVWGDPCNGEWSSSKVVNYINKNLNIENPFSEDTRSGTNSGRWTASRSIWSSTVSTPLIVGCSTAGPGAARRRG